MRSYAAAVLLLGLSMSASGQDKAKIEKEVMEADRERQAAIEKGDGQEWGKFIADGCRWSDLSTGEVLQNKAERVANITKNGPRESLKLSAEKFHVGDTLVTQTGVYTGSFGTMHFARVWQNQEGRWRMAALYVDRFPSE